MQDDGAEDPWGPDDEERGVAVGAAASPWRIWGPALGVLAALALVHWGLWLLLTRGAREVVADVEGQYDPSALAAATRPGREPEPRTDEWFRWQKNQRLWAEVERRNERQGWISTLRWGLTVSWLLQAGFVSWLALRAWSSAERGVARSRR